MAPTLLPNGAWVIYLPFNPHVMALLGCVLLLVAGILVRSPWSGVRAARFVAGCVCLLLGEALVLNTLNTVIPL